MTFLLLAAAAIAAYYYLRRPRTPGGGAGASAAAHARQLRTPAVRLADALHIPTQAGAEADRYEAGAAAERRTATRIDPLRAEGWTILHDRALPTGRANVDHLAISPHGVVILPDTKGWSSRYRIRVVNGCLLHGGWDVTDRLNGLRHETRTVSKALGVPVIPLVVMDGAPVEGGEQVLDGIRIVPADRACAVIRDLGRKLAHPDAPDVAARAARVLPPYQETAR
ncbi:hypothetical protein GCM10020227_11320 [Streptomyces flavovirens]|nr:NERD domain-containing protein [Streptomyces sp. MBT51]